VARAKWPRATHEAIVAARTALSERLPAGLDYLVACSGGPDSLALAATAAHLHQEGVLQGRVGAAIVDHALQPGSDEAAARAGLACAELGLSPVVVQRVDVEGTGNEADARKARYEALEQVRDRTGADYLLTAHTADDQAEQVLLSLARGSGTRSLAGIPERRPRVLRPFLEVRRAQTVAICAALGLDPWHDPTNDLPDARRNRVRHELLPVMRDVLGDGVDDALIRTARLARQDADLLDELAKETLAAAAVQDDPSVLGGVDDRVDGRAPLVWDLRRAVVLEAPAALRSRVLRQVAVAVGGRPPTAERTAALEKLAAGTGAPGPVQLDGMVSATRIRADDGESLLRFRGL
jgi:tRNA(Ile)-lysidine synthase